MAKRRLQDLSPRSRRLLVGLGVVQISLNLAAQIDISRRSPSQLRGSKIRWRLVSFINVFGPLAYFCWGRHPKRHDRGPATIRPVDTLGAARSRRRSAT